jgi:hypothetical protein
VSEWSIYWLDYSKDNVSEWSIYWLNYSGSCKWCLNMGNKLICIPYTIDIYKKWWWSLLNDNNSSHNFLENSGLTVSDNIEDIILSQVLEKMGVTDYLQTPQCDLMDYTDTVGGWTNGQIMLYCLVCIYYMEELVW